MKRFILPSVDPCCIPVLMADVVELRAYYTTLPSDLLDICFDCGVYMGRSSTKSSSSSKSDGFCDYSDSVFSIMLFQRLRFDFFIVGGFANKLILDFPMASLPFFEALSTDVGLKTAQPDVCSSDLVFKHYYFASSDAAFMVVKCLYFGS